MWNVWQSIFWNSQSAHKNRPDICFVWNTCPLQKSSQEPRKGIKEVKTPFRINQKKNEKATACIFSVVNSQNGRVGETEGGRIICCSNKSLLGKSCWPTKAWKSVCDMLLCCERPLKLAPPKNQKATTCIFFGCQTLVGNWMAIISTGVYSSTRPNCFP